jgi:hypothetical protein
MRRARRWTGYGTLGAAAAVLVVTSCSPSPPHPAQTHGNAAGATPGAVSAGTPPSSSSKPPVGTSTGPLGATLAVSDSSGTKLDVTVKKLIDPAGGANSYSKPASGKRFVGVKLRVKNIAASTYQNNANNETVVVLSDGKTRHANYKPIASCGNFDNGQIKLKSGAASTGCVTFQVPDGQKVVKVSYGNTVFPGTTAQWRVS